MTCQYEISVVISQTTFRGETSVGICWLFFFLKFILACQQALRLLESREVMWEQHTKGNASESLMRSLTPCFAHKWGAC